MFLKGVGYLLSKKYHYLGPYNTQLDKIPINQLDKLACEHDILYQFHCDIGEVDYIYSKKFIKYSLKNYNILGFGVGIILLTKYVLEKFLIKIYP